MAFELPGLSYSYDALEPHIDARTMEIHHTKHHQAYINNANAALERHSDLADKTAEELIADLNAVPEDIRTAIRNNAGGHANHTLFWTVMAPQAGGSPQGEHRAERRVRPRSNDEIGRDRASLKGEMIHIPKTFSFPIRAARYRATPARCSAYIPTGMRASHRFGSLQYRAAQMYATNC